MVTENQNGPRGGSAVPASAASGAPSVSGTEPPCAALVPSRMKTKVLNQNVSEVQCQRKDTSLLDELASLIGSTLRAGEAAVVIATKTHRKGLERRLLARGVDLAILRKRDCYISLDVDRALSAFMVGAPAGLGAVRAGDGRSDRTRMGGRPRGSSARRGVRGDGLPVVEGGAARGGHPGEGIMGRIGPEAFLLSTLQPPRWEALAGRSTPGRISPSGRSLPLRRGAKNPMPVKTNDSERLRAFRHSITRPHYTRLRSGSGYWWRTSRTMRFSCWTLQAASSVGTAARSASMDTPRPKL